MTTRTLLALNAAIEAATGVALIVDPGLVIRVLLGVDLSGGGIAVGRVAGFGLFALGMACWPRGDQAGAEATFALFTYNLMTASYLCYLRIGEGFAGSLLWPAIALHALFTVLFAQMAYERVCAARFGAPSGLASSSKVKS